LKKLFPGLQTVAVTGRNRLFSQAVNDGSIWEGIENPACVHRLMPLNRQLTRPGQLTHRDGDVSEFMPQIE
jgi:hypothetical protein